MDDFFLFRLFHTLLFFWRKSQRIKKVGSTFLLSLCLLTCFRSTGAALLLHPPQKPHTCILRTGKKELCEGSRGRGRAGPGRHRPLRPNPPPRQVSERKRQRARKEGAREGPRHWRSGAKTWNTFLCYLQSSFFVWIYHTHTTHTNTRSLSHTHDHTRPVFSLLNMGHVFALITWVPSTFSCHSCLAFV